MKLKVYGALAAIALLAACSHTPPVTTGGAGSTGAPMSENGPAPGSEEDLVRNVGDRVFFELNSSTLNDSAQATLDKQAAWLAKYPNVTVQVAGNCDDRGTEEFKPRPRQSPRESGRGLPGRQRCLLQPHQRDQPMARIARPRWAITKRHGHRTETTSPR